MLKRILLLATAVAVLTVAPVLADHGHRRGHRRNGDSRVAVEAGDLAVAAHRLQTALEQGYRPWNRRQYRFALWAVERFEGEARRFRRFVRHDRPGPERLARHFERVLHAHSQAMAELRYVRLSRRVRYERRRTRQELRDVQLLVDQRLAYNFPRYSRPERYYSIDRGEGVYVEIDTPRFHARAIRGGP